MFNSLTNNVTPCVCGNSMLGPVHKSTGRPRRWRLPQSGGSGSEVQGFSASRAKAARLSGIGLGSCRSCVMTCTLALHVSTLPMTITRVAERSKAGWNRRFPLARPPACLGELARSKRHAVARIAGNGRVGDCKHGSSLCSPRTGTSAAARRNSCGIVGRHKHPTVTKMTRG